MRYAGEALFGSEVDILGSIGRMAETFSDNFGRLMGAPPPVDRNTFPGRLVGPATR